VVLRVRGSTGSLGKLTLQRDCGVSWRHQGHGAHHLEWLGSDSGWMTSNPEVISSLGLVPKNALVPPNGRAFPDGRQPGSYPETGFWDIKAGDSGLSQERSYWCLRMVTPFIIY
jgi:hypothetical protein